MALAIDLCKLATTSMLDDQLQNKTGKFSMNRIRLALGAIAVCLAMPVVATPSSTYSFGNSSIAGTSGITTWDNTSASHYGVNGDNYGNTYTFNGSAGSPSVTVSAWASTGSMIIGGTSNYDRLIQSAYVNRYPTSNPNELAVTSRPISGNGNAELDANHNPNTSSTVNQHAMDNVGSYESLMFSFQSAVTLDQVSIGFPPSNSTLDSDATILVYDAASDTNGTGLNFNNVRTYSQLLSNGWKIADNLLNLKDTGGSGTLSPTISSKYWMVGAYMEIGSNKNITVGNDYLKINGLKATSTLRVPEPSSIALIGIASMGLLSRRRKGARAV